MKIEDQVCTLEQSKRLKELGITVNSLFYHCQDKTPTGGNQTLYGYPQENMPILILYGKQSILSTSQIYFEFPAYTVAELGEMLPDALKSTNGERIINTQSKHFNNSEWIYSYRFEKTGGIAIAAPILPTEAQVRAAMLIILLENGYKPYNQIKP